MILKVTLLKNTNMKNKIQNTKETFGCTWTHPVCTPFTNELQMVCVLVKYIQLNNNFSFTIIF
jgi:hypothetical protein